MTNAGSNNSNRVECTGWQHSRSILTRTYPPDTTRNGRGKSQGDDTLRFELKWWTSNKPPMTWEDAESRPLEGQLAEIATQILVMGEAMFRDWQQQRYCDELKDREALIEKARLKR